MARRDASGTWMSPTRSQPLGAFTVDVEDYFQVTAFEGRISRDSWDDFESRVERNTYCILELLGKYDVRATFFVLGWVAERYPNVVRDIARAGHEIGSHGYWHRLIYEQTRNEFRDDLRRSRDVLEAIVAQPVTSFRAPSFSITKRSLWALEILAEERFLVDSSIVSMRHDRYGLPGARREVHHINTPAGSICEFPPTVVRIGRFHLPVGGGGYFRLYPFKVTKSWLKTAHRQTRTPLMFYIHPWEVDPDQPRLAAGSPSSRFRHYVGLEKTATKLKRLLTSFRFASVKEVLAAAGADPLAEGGEVDPAVPVQSCRAQGLGR